MKNHAPHRYNGGFEPLSVSSPLEPDGGYNPWPMTSDPAGGPLCESGGYPTSVPPYANLGGFPYVVPYANLGGFPYVVPYDNLGAFPYVLQPYGAGSQPGSGVVSMSNPEVMPTAYPRPGGTGGATRPLTVAHVGPYLLRAGAEQWLLDLARSLDPARLRLVRVIAIHGQLVDFEYVNELTRLGVTVEVGGEESVRAAARECDVLLSWGVELDHYLGETRAPVSVQVVHGDGPGNRWYLEGSARSIDHVVAVSHRVRRRLCQDRPTTVIYNGVDLGRLVPQRSRTRARAALGFTRDDFVVGYFGRLAPEKRVEAIIDAIALLPARFKLLMVGWGHQYPELREHASRVLPGRHQFTYTATALGDLYHAVDAVCLASREEGLPLVMLEAMSCGRPFVTTPVGAALEVIEDRVNGLIFDGGPAALASGLSNLARYPAWRRGVGRSGRLTFEQFGTARRMASDYEHLLHQLWAEKCAA
jgi:glycosyltransferase involved in cell wall biosynthesis